MKENLVVYHVEMKIIDHMPLFSYREICDIIMDSLFYCRKMKEMNLIGYLILVSRIHLIFETTGNPSFLIRDFKKQNSRLISNYIINDKTFPSREIYLRQMFERGEANRKVKYFQFWEHGFKLNIIDDSDLLMEELNYHHELPVKLGLVYDAKNWRYSSAMSHEYIKKGGINNHKKNRGKFLEDDLIEQCKEEVDVHCVLKWMGEKWGIKTSFNIDDVKLES